MRQTNLSLDELISMINTNEFGNYPSCLILNEVGVEFRKGSTEAEEILIKMLTNENDSFRTISICYLNESKKPSIRSIINEIAQNDSDVANLLLKLEL